MAQKTKQALLQELSGLDVDVVAELGIPDPDKASRDDLIGLIAVETARRAAAEADGDEVVDPADVEVVDDAPGDTTEDEAQSMSLAVIEEREYALQPVHALPSSGEWEALTVIATKLASTPFVPTAYRGQPESVLAAMMYGREIGLGPMQALQKIHMIDGKPAMAADLMLSQMRKGGVVILASESTSERAWINARRKDTGEQAEVEWTIEEARQVPAKERNQQITLAEKGTWKAYPSDMLWARCVGRLARRLGSDLLGGMVYSSEEVADWNDGDFGGGGYDTDTRPQQQQRRGARPATSDGVELRADAPLGWGAISEAMKAIDAGMDWAAWTSQAMVALAGKAKLADLDDTENKDVGIRVANGLAHLTEALAGRDFPPPSRDEIQQAFGFADSIDVRLDGPPEPLDPTEAAAAREDGDQEAADGVSGAADALNDVAEGADEGETGEGDTEPHEEAPIPGSTPEVDPDSLPDFGGGYDRD